MADFSLARLIAGAGTQGLNYLELKRQREIEDERRQREKEMHDAAMRSYKNNEALADLELAANPMFTTSLPVDPVQGIGQARNQVNDLFKPGVVGSMPNKPGAPTLSTMIRDFSALPSNKGWIDHTKKAPDLREGTEGWWQHQGKIDERGIENAVQREQRLQREGLGSYHTSASEQAQIDNIALQREDRELQQRLGQAEGRAAALAREGHTLQEIVEELGIYNLPSGYADGIAENAITRFESHLADNEYYLREMGRGLTDDNLDDELPFTPTGAGGSWEAPGALGGAAAGAAAGFLHRLPVTAAQAASGAAKGGRLGWPGAVAGGVAGGLFGGAVGGRFGGGDEDPQVLEARADWDALAARYGEAMTTQRIGPRP